MAGPPGEDPALPLTLDDFLQRVYAARHAVFRERGVEFGPDVWTLRVSNESYARLLTELRDTVRWRTALSWPGGEPRAFGYRVLPDRDLGNHEIRWRAEVVA